MNYKNFDVSAGNITESNSDIKFEVRVLNSPCGEMLEPETSTLSKTYVNDGELLFKALFTAEVKSLFLRSKEKLTANEGLRIRLHLVPALQIYPWEIMSCNVAGGELSKPDRIALNPRFSIVRYIDMMESVSTTSLEMPVRILFAAASPENDNMMPLRIDNAKEKFNESCGSNNSLIPISIVPASRNKLFSELSNDSTAMFVFFGHGHFPQIPDETNKGCIYLERENKKAEEMSADDLSLLLRNSSTRIVIFLGCKTAMRDSQHYWYGIGPALAKSGVAAIIAMQSNISEDSGLIMTKSILKSFRVGLPIDKALYLARLELSKNSSSDWGIPVLFMRDDTGKIFPDNKPSERKWLFVVIILLATILTTFFLSYHHFGNLNLHIINYLIPKPTSRIDFYVDLPNTTIKCDGKKINEGVNKLYNGRHKVITSCPGFVSDTQEIIVSEDKVVPITLTRK